MIALFVKTKYVQNWFIRHIVKLIFPEIHNTIKGTIQKCTYCSVSLKFVIIKFVFQCSSSWNVQITRLIERFVSKNIVVVDNFNLYSPSISDIIIYNAPNSSIKAYCFSLLYAVFYYWNVIFSKLMTPYFDRTVKKPH